MTSVDPLFVDTNVLIYAHVAKAPLHEIVATMLAFDIPCLLTHNTKDFERFADLITIHALME